MRDVWRAALWGLHAAYEGVHPNQDVDGHPDARSGQDICGGFFLVPWILKGDLDYFAKGLHLCHYSSNSFCEHCAAFAGDNVDWRWNNFRSDAQWMLHSYTTPEWRAKHPNLHWLFVKFPFLNQHNIEGDELHIVFLGVVQCTLGSVLWLLCHRCLPGRPADNLAEVWAFIADFYRSHHTSTQVSNLRLSQFEPRDGTPYPKLKGKAAEAKDLVEPVLAAWEHFRNDDTYEYEQVRRMLTSQFEAQNLISDHGSDIFLPPGQARSYFKSVLDFLQSYSILANKADSDGDRLWSMTPKFHWYYHLAQRAKYLSPRVSACWRDEAFVGHIKHIVSSAVNGTSMEQVPCVVADKMRWAIHFMDMDIVE